MNELLNSLKSDLLDRRVLPFLALLGVVLVAAVAYAVLGGGSSSGSAPVAATPVSPTTTGPALPVREAPSNPNAALAETTDGARYQHGSGAHNPFSPLASAKKASPSSSASGSSSATQSSAAPSSTSTAGSSGESSGGTIPVTPAEPAPPAKTRKPKTVYVVDILYGFAPTTPGQLSQLTPYAGLKRLEPLPSASDPKLIYAGVSATGKGAIFTLTGEAILKGEGSCMPSATQCEAVDLAAGKSEEFSYVEADGTNAAYLLKVVSIAKRQASAATAARLNRRNHLGLKLMRHLAPAVLKHLRFSSAKGVLVYAVRGRRR